jgi:hypothetical protein
MRIKPVVGHIPKPYPITIGPQSRDAFAAAMKEAYELILAKANTHFFRNDGKWRVEVESLDWRSNFHWEWDSAGNLINDQTHDPIQVSPIPRQTRGPFQIELIGTDFTLTQIFDIDTSADASAPTESAQPAVQTTH